MNPLNQGHSGTARETSRNVFSGSQGKNEDDSQSNPHPEAGLFSNQMTQNSGREDGHDNLICWSPGEMLSAMSVVIPGWKNMAAMPWSCHDHTMIMAKHGHDHAMMTPWRPCFLPCSSWFIAWSWHDYHVFHDSYHDHGMIIMLSMFFFLKNGLFVNVCSNSCCRIPLYGTIGWLYRNLRLPTGESAKLNEGYSRKTLSFPGQ